MHAARRFGKNALLRAAYPRWPPREQSIDGYTVLLPLPGDLPVFLELALAGLSNQDPTGHVETLVIADRLTPGFRETFQRCCERLPWGPVRLVAIDRRGQLLQRTRRGPWSRASSYLNHFLQIYHGIAATKTTHAILHDADLFLTDGAFLADRYRRCADAGLACLGVERRYDDFYDRNALGPVLATWELMLRTDWIRTFAPWRLSSQSIRLAGFQKDLDTMDYVQVRTPPAQRDLWEAPDSYVHFNWVIIHYRLFQQTAGHEFVDGYFLILLVRLLSDAFAQTDGSNQLPPLSEMVRGITDSSARVHYCQEGIEERYAEFRGRIQRVIEGPALGPAQAESIERALRPFDLAFG
jgi:hypothetical protein